MSKPPEDEDALFQILEQIKQAITDSDVVESEDVEIIDELEQGIRYSLEALMGMSQSAEPNITVVDGGVSEDNPIDKETVDSEKTKPQLSILPSNSTDEEEASGDEWDFPNVQVRVLSGDRLFPQLKAFAKGREEFLKGDITLQNGESQVVLRAEELQMYRISCVEGSLRLSSHFEELVLTKGQSADLQTTHLTVTAEGDAVGQYYRLS